MEYKCYDCGKFLEYIEKDNLYYCDNVCCPAYQVLMAPFTAHKLHEAKTKIIELNSGLRMEVFQFKSLNRNYQALMKHCKVADETVQTQMDMFFPVVSALDEIYGLCSICDMIPSEKDLVCDIMNIIEKVHKGTYHEPMEQTETATPSQAG